MIIAGVSISNFIDDEVKKEMANDPKAQALAKKWEVVANNLLDLCRTSDTSEDKLEGLQNCKTDLQNLRKDCNENSVYSKTDFCLNTDFQELDKSFDQRITIVQEKIQALEQKVEDLKKQSEDLESSRPEFNEDVFEFANDSVLGYLDYCMEYPSERCTEDAKEMLRLCSIDASVKACSDPRMKEIANLGSNQESSQESSETKIGYLPHTRDECIPNKVCFVLGDYLTYNDFIVIPSPTPYDEQSTSNDGFIITNYTYAGPFDVDKILVNIDVISIQENGNFTLPQTVKPMDLCCWLDSGGQSDVVIQSSPVRIEKWTVDSPSAETWKNKVAEDSYNYNGFMRKVIVINIESPSEIIDKETGILLFHHDNWFGPDRTVRLVATNIIQSSNFP